MCSNCRGDYENPDYAVIEMDQDDTEAAVAPRTGVKLLGAWTIALAFCGAVWAGALFMLFRWVAPFFQKLQLM